MGVNGKALQLHTVYKKPYFLQVTRESVSGTTSHVHRVWMCNEIKGSYDKIIITIVPSYTGKNITRLLPLALLLVLCTRNNTDGNKLVIFSGIALYYGDTYILSTRWEEGWSSEYTCGLKLRPDWNCLACAQNPHFPTNNLTIAWMHGSMSHRQ